LATESVWVEKVLDQVLEGLVGQALAVGPRRVAEDAASMSGLADSSWRRAVWMAMPTFFGLGAHRSSAPLGNLEAVVLGNSA
jgi:hypothetical protein